MPNDEQILDYIRTNPGQRARDIAAILGIDKSVLNSTLYGSLRSKVVQDHAYKWRVKDTVQSAQRPLALQTAPDTQLAKLCRYYLECLSQDDQEGVSVFASSSFGGLDYAEFQALPQLVVSEGTVFDDEPVKRFLRKLKSGRNRPVPLLGYPIQLTHIRSKKGWEGFAVQPIFLFKLDNDSSNNSESPLLADEPPQINFKALRSLIVGDGGSGVINESVELAEELGLDEAGLELPDIEELILRLREIRPEWNWREETNPLALSAHPSIAELVEPGIYNRAVLLSTDGSPYTKGLESELAKLKAIPASQYESTSLGSWIGSQPIKAEAPEIKPLLEVLPLNSEQRQAVLQGLHNPLTLITGPPGTGKSQVVTSLLINAAWQGKTALFTSKNNKAVDVVEMRVNSLGPRPVLLRLGPNQFQSKLTEYLVSLLAATSSIEDERRYSEFHDLLEKTRQRFTVLDSQMAQTIALRNEVDRLEQCVESIRQNLGPVIFSSFRDFDRESAHAAIQGFELKVRDATKDKQPLPTRVVWRFIKSKRNDRLAEALSELEPTARQLGSELPTLVQDDQMAVRGQGFIAQLLARMDEATKSKEYFSALCKLNSAKTLEDISREHRSVLEEIANLSGSLWNAWLRLQPKRMTPEDRRLLSEYNSLLQLIVSANDDGQRLGSQIFARYHQLFPKITKILSCWAVTSLSAKGRVPFDPQFFDILIVDEASQCDIASILPLLFRAKKVVIIGDPKQLRHISRVPIARDRQLLQSHGLAEGSAAWAYSVNSVFDLARSLCRSEDIVELRDHHRSHSDIISFSNQYFYEDRLRVATNHNELKSLNSEGPAVRWIDVCGSCVRPANGGAMNDEEARAVVNEIERLLFGIGYTGSIGVVTPFRAQANRINDLISQQQNLNARLSDANFLAQTVDRFQGDERDLMIFSPVVSLGVPIGALMFLRSRPNLFNVAITRARAALIVVGDRQASLACGVDYLKAFAAYTESLGPKPATMEGSRYPQSVDYPTVVFPDHVSDWEKMLYRALHKAGCKPMAQYDVEKYTLDLALADGDRMLDIEVDGERYHRNCDGELCRRDQIRNQRLFELGWDVMRFGVYQVRDDINGCVERIRRWADRVESE
jgi:very-short-patch-repair endonuclease